ncbi:hypothetical protein ERX46_15220 [Brumimicrobium glaciale]|uniref:4'-phosphopantetheinyl transferase superfamily protein n=1 Tax=Brumimicrobium glaciale TaxID=200475 RepID=A0A4V1WF57_9FLAO|nr:hypothetical protein [Brumimicrobium glaciale]RYM32036.1 hypothetical protein ERX46_15220 [Brumimicrobium glaciale]
MNTRIETNEGLIHLWFDSNYETKRSKGLSKRDIEVEEVRNKLQESFPKARIEYEENGAPILLGASYSYISISHYGGWFALYYTEKPNGVDIQTYKSTLLKGKDYFINSKDEELELSSLNLHLIWSAKEEFYKKHKGNILNLRKDVSAIEINHESKELTLIYEGQEEVVCFYVSNDFVLVWT